MPKTAVSSGGFGGTGILWARTLNHATRANVKSYGRARATMQSVRLELPTADRLARGDLNRYLFGQKMPHKLTPREWPAYEAAKETGYLVTPSVGLARIRLRNC